MQSLSSIQYFLLDAHCWTHHWLKPDRLGKKFYPIPGPNRAFRLYFYRACGILRGQVSNDFVWFGFLAVRTDGLIPVSN
jgi:hypothetical protein